MSFHLVHEVTKYIGGRNYMSYIKELWLMTRCDSMLNEEELGDWHNFNMYNKREKENKFLQGLGHYLK